MNPRPPRSYCGALPPWSRQRSCLKSPGHEGDHRDMDGRTWSDEPAERAAP